MSNQSPDTKEDNFRLYWKALYEYNDGFQTILYRIENLIVYTIELENRTISIRHNQGKVIPNIAEPITQEEYEVYLLRYLI